MKNNNPSRFKTLERELSNQLERKSSTASLMRIVQKCENIYTVKHVLRSMINNQKYSKFHNKLSLVGIRISFPEFFLDYIKGDYHSVKDGLQTVDWTQEENRKVVIEYLQNKTAIDDSLDVYLFNELVQGEPSLKDAYDLLLKELRLGRKTLLRFTTEAIGFWETSQSELRKVLV